MTVSPVRAYTQPLWDYLRSLSIFSFPSDLSEIDANWLYCTLEASDDEDVHNSLERSGYSDMVALAWDLRDCLHTAMCEQMEWQRQQCYDYYD